MPRNQARFVTACQQLLALGVVLAVLTPAANVLNLDVVAQPPATGPALAGSAVLSSAEVPAEPVEPEVTEYALEPQQADAKGKGTARKAPGGVAGDAAPADEALASAPVEGFGAVGVTWAADAEVAEDELTLQVRTREGDSWSEWTEMEYHDEHAPDAGSPDALSARPGTEALIVGEVDEVEVRADADQALPEGLSLSVVDPGEADRTREEAPALGTDTAGEPAAAAEAQGDGLVLQAAARKKAAPQPTIYSRAQWGANEKIRNKKSLRYGSISAGFVHHTVNANDYTADQVPGIIRSIYAYHVKSRGWSDIGYNFLVDRFGRIWEGRFGGIDKAVVGAHTYGYNDYAFAMSAIGNFELVRPSSEVIAAYGALFAWKLGLHGVDPASKSQKVGRKVFPAINGHRDAGSTACPGRYLYAKLPDIRKAASAAGSAPKPTPTPPPSTPQWGEPQLKSNLVGTPHPDLVVRRASDGRGLIIPTGGLTGFNKTRVVSPKGWRKRAWTVVTPDITGDGVADLVFVTNKGGKVRPGNGKGGFKKVVRTVRGMRNVRMLTAVGDINADGRNDFVAKVRGKRRVGVAFLGTPKGGFKKVRLDRAWGRYTSLTGVGDINTDGRPDLMGIDGAGRVWTRLGDGPASFAKARRTPGDWSAYTTLVGGLDQTGDGRPDVFARQANGKVYVLPGVGDGTFGHPIGPVVNVPRLKSLSTARVTGTPGGDLIARRGKSLVVVPNRGTFDLAAPIDTGANLSGATLILNVGDWDRDGFGDVVTRQRNGNLVLRRGNGQGQLADPVVIGKGWPQGERVEALGDVNGDGFPDLLRTPADGQPLLYRGKGMQGFMPTVAAGGLAAPLARMTSATSSIDLSPYDWKVTISDAQLKQRNDVLLREKGTGRLYLANGTKKRGLRGLRYLGDGMGSYDLAG